MVRINEKGHVTWHETCTCTGRLNANAFNNKQSWNNHNCRCECKKLIDMDLNWIDDGFIRNPGICECVCDR